MNSNEKRNSTRHGVARYSKPQRSCALALLLTVLLFLVHDEAAAAETLGKTYTDREFGFAIRPPKDWGHVAPRGGERYLVASFVMKNRLQTSKMKNCKDFNFHRPLMNIVVFTEANRSFGAGSKITYKDFEEYTRGTTSGFYFGDTKESKIRGLSCSQIDIVMEQCRPPLRRRACVYHLDEADVVVYFEIMEDHFDKYERFFDKVFRSFKTVKKDNRAQARTEPDDAKPKTRKEYIRSKTEHLPKDWKWKASKSHLVISHTDKKVTDKVLKFADAMRKKISDELNTKSSRPARWQPDQTTHELPVIRICKDRAEFDAYTKSAGTRDSFFTRAYRFGNGELVIYNGLKDGYGFRFGFDMNDIYGGLGWGIFKDCLYREFEKILPDAWYAYGMNYHYSCFKLKGSRLEYVPNTYLPDRYREVEREAECRSLKSLMDPEGIGIQKKTERWKVGTLAAFLKSRDGRKKPWKGILDKYLDNFRLAVEEEINELIDAEKDKPHLAASNQIVTTKVKLSLTEVRRAAFELTFGDWSDKDWNRLEAAWKKWAL